MKAIIINNYGGLEVIETTLDIPRPKAQSSQVVIEVHAASLNPIDKVLRAGYLQQMLPVAFPVVMGGDFAGVIAEIGEEVTEFKVGDEVYGQAGPLLGGLGSLAEYTATPAAKTAKKPGSLSMVQAASIPLAGATALQAIEEHIKLQQGQSILIHGGTGGVGSLAIQIAKMKGAFVAATVDAPGMELAKQLGADEVFDYKTQPLSSLNKTYDAVLVTANDALAGSYQLVRKGGVLVSLSAAVDQHLVKEAGITAINQMTQASQTQLKTLAEYIDSGKLKPVLDKTFSLEETKEAFEYFEQQHPKGKVTVKVKP